MSVSDANIAFAVELFEDLGAITTRKMFGGICVYNDGTVFALMSSDGRLYLKAKDEVENALKAEGAEQYHNMPYWSLPDAALEDPELALDWVKRTLPTL